MSWTQLDIQQWRTIVKNDTGLTPMKREAFLSALDEMERSKQQLRAHRIFVKALVEKSERFICPVCDYLFDECKCGVGADDFAASIQDELGVSQRGEQQ